MANMYRVVYAKANKEGDVNQLVQATSVANAIAAVKTLTNFKAVVTVTEVGSSNIVVGS
jgi:hypothetical protein